MSRYYDIEGEQYISVTSVCDEIRKIGLEKWYKANSEEFCQAKLEQAGDRGTLVHQLIEEWFNEPSWDRGYDMGPEGYFKSFGLWAEEFKPKPLFIEKQVHNTSQKYAGTFDWLGTLGDSPTMHLIDWKTSPDEYESHAIQGIAYKQAIITMVEDHAMFGLQDNIVDMLGDTMAAGLIKVSVLRLRENGKQAKFRTIKYAAEYELFEHFKALKKFGEWRKGWKNCFEDSKPRKKKETA